MRTLMTCTRITAFSHPRFVAAAGVLLTLALLLGNVASTAHAYGPALEISNFQAQDLGYYDMYTFTGKVINAQDPGSLKVDIYINGNHAGTTDVDAAGNFGINLMCPGGEVTVETFASPFQATATLEIS